MTPNSGLSGLVHDLRTTLGAISEGLVEGCHRLLDAEPRLAELAARLQTTPLDAASAPLRYDRSGRHPAGETAGVLQARG